MGVLVVVVVVLDGSDKICVRCAEGLFRFWDWHLMFQWVILGILYLLLGSNVAGSIQRPTDGGLHSKDGYS